MWIYASYSYILGLKIGMNNMQLNVCFFSAQLGWTKRDNAVYMESYNK